MADAHVDVESVSSATSVTETANELPLLSALRENGQDGQPYVPVEPERPIVRYMQQHSNPQMQLQSGLVRFWVP